MSSQDFGAQAEHAYFARREIWTPLHALGLHEVCATHCGDIFLVVMKYTLRGCCLIEWRGETSSCEPKPKPHLPERGCCK